MFYGAAEFSRDVDLVLLADGANLERVRLALQELGADLIAVPAFRADFLAKGHAVHFRCHGGEVEDLRVDVMAVMRGVAPFEELWERRTTLLVDGEEVDLLSLQDLVAAKKTQRDKDWPMIRRLVERSYFGCVGTPSENLVSFWMLELRTPDLLCTIAAEHHAVAAAIADSRPAVRSALAGDVDGVRALLALEESEERERDRVYWEPLRRELEELRRAKRLAEDTKE